MPAIKVMRNPGTHHVDISTAKTPAKPTRDAHGPGGPSRRKAMACFLWNLRNARCVSSVISHANSAPNVLSPTMKTKSESLNRSDRNSAAAIPPQPPENRWKIAAARQRERQPRSEVQVGHRAGERRRQHHKIHDVTRCG